MCTRKRKTVRLKQHPILPATMEYHSVCYTYHALLQRALHEIDAAVENRFAVRQKTILQRGCHWRQALKIIWIAFKTNAPNSRRCYYSNRSTEINTSTIGKARDIVTALDISGTLSVIRWCKLKRVWMPTQNNSFTFHFSHLILLACKSL